MHVSKDSMWWKLKFSSRTKHPLKKFVSQFPCKLCNKHFYLYLILYIYMCPNIWCDGVISFWIDTKQSRMLTHPARPNGKRPFNKPKPQPLKFAFGSDQLLTVLFYPASSSPDALYRHYPVVNLAVPAFLSPALFAGWWRVLILTWCERKIIFLLFL
jgi:hypothetical protein